jgi:dCTP deaminase
VILNYEDILSAKGAGNIFIDPFNETQLGTNSYDVALGNWFIPLERWNITTPEYGDFFYAPDDTQVQLSSSGILLAITKERIGSRGHIVPILRTRSTMMRMGIDLVASAGIGDIGYYDQPWVVGIRSSVAGAYLVAGATKVGQVLFFKSNPTSYPYKGQYSKDDWPISMLPNLCRDKYRDIDFDEIKRQAIAAHKKHSTGEKSGSTAVDR